MEDSLCCIPFVDQLQEKELAGKSRPNPKWEG
jgi:hypothetical protein